VLYLFEYNMFICMYLLYTLTDLGHPSDDYVIIRRYRKSREH